MRVCFFGAYDSGYPRNRILREGLRRAGIEVHEARVAQHRVIRRYPALLGAFWREGRDADVLLVPEFRHKDMPLARALAGRRRVVFDPLVSRHDTLVDDWGLHGPGSAQARWNDRIDRMALALADIVLCDTWAHGRLYEQLGARRDRLRRVLVGAEDVFFGVGPPPPAPPVRVVYLGGFLPLHGISIVLEAAARLERDATRLPDFRIELVGRGIEFDGSVEWAKRAGLERVGFPGPVEYADAARVYADAHVVLGAFGAGEKAGRVIPHKLYQGLASGRAVVTGDGPGVREVFEAGVHLETVPRGDAEALAEALRRLIRNPDVREGLAARGRARVLEVGTADRIGESLREALLGGEAA